MEYYLAITRIGLDTCYNMCAFALQLYLSLCDPVDYSLPGSSVLEILQARILE